MKETTNTLKTLSSDTPSKEKDQRQAVGDDAFLKKMGALAQKPQPVVTSPIIPPMSEPRNQFQCSMTNFRPNSSMVSHQGNMPRDLSGSQQEL